MDVFVKAQDLPAFSAGNTFQHTWALCVVTVGLTLSIAVAATHTLGGHTTI